MARFASSCLERIKEVTLELEKTLGPDTTNISLRVGLHSGPVTAGVLRGEKSRFQLFGDTMNTAARMESTGVPGKVQISQETYELLSKAGKSHWGVEREEKVQAKGKGELKTYFLKTADGRRTTTRSRALSVSSGGSVGTRSMGSMDLMIRDNEENIAKRNRIADWMSEVMASLLREIEVRRRAMGTKKDSASKIRKLELKMARGSPDTTVIDEVKEIIELPEFDGQAARIESTMDPQDIKLNAEVLEELKEFVRAIASLYKSNRECIRFHWGISFTLSRSLTIFVSFCIQHSTTFTTPITSP